MKSPTRTWYQTYLRMWLLLGTAGVMFLALVILAWEYQDARIATAAIAGYGALIAFFLIGAKEYE